MRPYVLLEMGTARVTPSVSRDLTSWVHDHLFESGQQDSFAGNTPRGVRCLHPTATLLEKLDAIMHKFGREPFLPETFVRHYEDSARIIESESELPRLEGDATALLSSMLESGDLRVRPTADQSAFQSAFETPKLEALRLAHAELAPLYWGDRMSLDDCCERIRFWLDKTL